MSSLPSYFTRTPPADWALKAYLEGEYSKRGKGYDHTRVVGAWIAALRCFDKDAAGDGEKAAAANRLLAKYFTERPSDRMAAKAWYESRKRANAQNGRKQRQKERERKKEKEREGVTVDFKPNISFAPSWTVSQVNGGPASAPEPQLGEAAARNLRPRTPSTTTPTVVSDDSSRISESRAPSPVDNAAHARPAMTSAPAAQAATRQKPGPDVPPSDPARPPAAPPAYDAPPESETLTDLDEPETRLEEVCSSLHQVYTRMTEKLKLKYCDGTVEDTLYEHALSLSELMPAHFFILDAGTLPTLFPKDNGYILNLLPSLSVFPLALERRLSAYDEVHTLGECRSIASNRMYATITEDLLWLDGCLVHTVRLLTSTGGLLQHVPLHEGVWDCLVYAPLWDAYFASLSGLVLQRKEIPLAALADEPYAFLPYEPRYDGVLASREGVHASRGRGADAFELAVWETSARFEGTDNAKWRKDRTKVLAGCRAMLCRLVELVGYVKGLQVVGVLQAGRWTQVFVMTALGRNVFFLKEGEIRQFPARIEDLAKVFDLLGAVWKARQIVEETEKVVRAKLEKRAPGEKRKRTDGEFL